MTQAGGKLAKSLVEQIAEYANRTNKQFFIMYGQTEATARIACLAADKALSKPDSIGKPVEGGSLSLVGANGEQITETGKVGELVYRGMNIMLGYVSGVNELTSLPGMQSLLTGDYGYFDADGDFFIVGRLKRMIKLFGERCSLDELERHLAQKGFDVKCVGTDDQVGICLTGNDHVAVRKAAIELLRIPPKAVATLSVPHWPLLENGKIDYAALYKRVFDIQG
jgi:long-chain acyl-CoA synthetase